MDVIQLRFTVRQPQNQAVGVNIGISQADILFGIIKETKVKLLVTMLKYFEKRGTQRPRIDILGEVLEN